MSRYLYATKIEVVTKDFIHNNTYLDGAIHEPLKVVAGTVIAEAEDGFYVYTPPFAKPLTDMVNSKCWPKPENGTIQLARDYWRYLSEKDLPKEQVSPAVLVIMLAPKTTVVQA